MLAETRETWLSHLAEGSEKGTSEALRVYCEQIIPLLLEVLRKRFRNDYPGHPREGRYDGLVSLLGYTPETVVLAYKFTQPDTLVVLHTDETAPFVEQVRKYTGAPAGSLYAERFAKESTEQLYTALSSALNRFNRNARVAIELTGGTKPMGAALQIPAAVNDIDTLYIDFTKYMAELRKPDPEHTYIRLMENPLKTHFNILRPVHLGLMAAAATHELNQPVGIIRSTAQSALLDLREGLLTPEELPPLLKTILNQTERMAAVIENFRRFGRGNRVARDEVIDLNHLLERTIGIFAEQFRVRNISLHLHLSKEKPPIVKANSVLLEEIMLNLLSNARDALLESKDGSIWIDTWSDRQGKNGFSIADNGPGLPASYRNLLFVPFMSTKAPDKGSGMGLFVSRRILDDLGGTISYEDRPGGGARFRIELPAHEV